MEKCSSCNKNDVNNYMDICSQCEKESEEY